MRKNGFSLLEMMVAIGMLGGLSALLATFIVNQSKSLSVHERYLTMHNIAKRVAQYAMRPDVIATSVSFQLANTTNPPREAGNQDLAHCISKDPSNILNNAYRVDPSLSFAPGRCTTTDSSRQKEISLYKPFASGPGVATPKEIKSHRVVGDDVTYSIITGKLCTNNLKDKGCHINVRAYFWASCALDAHLGDKVIANTQNSSTTRFPNI